MSNETSSNVYTSDVAVDQATRDQLSESIRLREQRLAANVDELVGRLHPKAIASRATAQVSSAFVQPSGKPRVERIALIGGVVLTVVALGAFAAVRSRG